MKTCPQCQTSYTDDTLQFCLQDGTPLASQSFSGSGVWGESETLVSPNQPDKIRVDVENAPPPSVPSGWVAPPPPAKKRSTGLIVALTALLTLLIAGAGALAALYYLRNGKTQVAQNTNSKPVNTPTATPVANIRANANSAAANTTPSPTATPTSKPALGPKQIESIQSEVGNVIGDWKDATENLDINAHLDNYADTVDYYRAGRVGIDRVREDKQRAFESYDEVDIDISNMKITPDEMGEKATAVFDKEWTFRGETTYSSGRVQQQLQLVRSGGKWRIAGEKDLQVYELNNR